MSLNISLLSLSQRFHGGPGMNKEQIIGFFKVIDKMDCEKFAAFLDENGEFKFGSASTVKGRAEIKKGHVSIL